MSKKIELTEEEENNILLFYSEVKNKSATVRHFGITLYALNKIIKEKGDFFKNKTKIEIVNLSRELSTDKDLLFYYVADLFGIPVNDCCFVQAKNFLSQGYTYRGMYLSLKYFYEIKKGNIEKANGGIGIIPYIYSEAKAYYTKVETTKAKIEAEIKKYLEEKKEIVKINPSMHYCSSKRKSKKINISEME